MSLSHGIRENDCCTRCQESAGCAQVRHSGIVILTAITVIALLASVLLIVAKAGYPLGQINSIVKMVPPHLLYLGLGLTGVALILSTLLIGAQLHNYLKK